VNVSLQLADNCELVGKCLPVADVLTLRRAGCLVFQTLDNQGISGRYPIQLMAFLLKKSAVDAYERNEEERNSDKHQPTSENDIAGSKYQGCESDPAREFDGYVHQWKNGRDNWQDGVDAGQSQRGCPEGFQAESSVLSEGFEFQGKLPRSVDSQHRRAIDVEESCKDEKEVREDRNGFREDPGETRRRGEQNSVDPESC